MKPAVAIALLVGGVVLFGMRPLSDCLMQRNLHRLLESSSNASVSLRGEMGLFYRLGCFAAGSAMIAIAIFCSMRTAAMQAGVSQEDLTMSS